MSWFYFEILLISLGITVGLFFAYQGYKYFLSGLRKNQVYVPRIVLHSLERNTHSGELLFHFELVETQEITLEICNDNFESLKVIFKGELPEGSHTQKFLSTELPNGTYFYRLKGQSQQVMKKMTIEN
ncbi:MAG TPA: hypothetical protein VD905_03665 [Flavobacteriales bacterium]|nr:hypothetical protein [Flavobacteriales bacterium]